MKTKRILNSVICLMLILILPLVFLACNKDDAEITDIPTSDTQITLPTESDMFTSRDLETEYSLATVTKITLNKTVAQAEGSGATVSGSTITISAAGEYLISGNLEKGQIIVSAGDSDKVRLILENVSIENTDSAVIYIQSADKTFLTLVGQNTLSTTGSFAETEEGIDATIYSKDDLTINGEGSLSVTCASGHGIVDKDDIKLIGGNISITANGGHAINANDSVRIYDGDLTLVSAKDGIHIENTDDTTKGYFYVNNGKVQITSGYDGIDASGAIQIKNIDYSAKCGSGSNGYLSSTSSSQKGLKATGSIEIVNGNFVINSTDDAIHSNASLQIDNGTFTLASGDDGIHADESATVNGGVITISKSYEGIEGKNITINGGDISLTASDDGLNSAGGADGSAFGGRPGQNSFSTDGSVFITITGGKLYINAQGDGIDSNGNLYVSGGDVFVEGPTSNGNGALDYDATGQITGGAFVAIGSSGMAQNFTNATQGSILLSFSAQSAGTKIEVLNSNNETIISVTASKAYQSLVVSSPKLTEGETYTINAGTISKSVTLSSNIYGSGQGSFGGGGIRK